MNTIPLLENRKPRRLTIIDASHLFAEVIKRNHSHSSISELYEAEETKLLKMPANKPSKLKS